MKKYIWIVWIIIICLLYFALSYSNKIESTNLTNIGVDKFRVGQELGEKDLSKYTESDRFSGNYKYKFDELIIDTKTKKKVKKINYLFSRLDENKTKVTINGRKVLTKVDIWDELGDNYIDRPRDYFQDLREMVYKDHKNKIEAKFIYLKIDSSLCWVEITKK